MELLREPLVAGLNPIQIAAIAGGVMVIWFLVKLLRRLLGSRTPGQYEALMKCRDCGWTGVVGKFHPACRKCAGKSMRPA